MGTRRRGSAQQRTASVLNSDMAMCKNNFLRNHNTEDDYIYMEERLTSLKGYGVFAKVAIAKVIYSLSFVL